MNPPKTGKVLRLALAVDGMLCEEVHQSVPGSVQFGVGLRNELVVHDGNACPKDYRRYAPLWLILGVLVTCGGAALFGAAVLHQAALADARAAADLGLGGAFSARAELTIGDLGFALIFVGLVPLVMGLSGMRDKALTSSGAHKPTLPSQPGSFEYKDGSYYLSVPPHVRGKIRLGRLTTTLTQLRMKIEGDGLRLKLPPNARGKLLVGDSTLLFQFARPAAVPVRLPFPPGLRSGLRIFGTAKLDLQCYAASLVGVGGYVLYMGVLAEPPLESEPDQRMLEAMGIFQRDSDEPSEEEAPEEEEQVLAQEDEKEKEEEVEEDDTEVLKEKPKKFSEEAIKKARGVGIARVLGTYGGPGEGTVFDVIQGTENNLGDLFAMGMTQTVMADGGEISPFMAGGEGITAHGAMSANEGLATRDGPEVAGGKKRERKVKGRVKSKTTDIFGDVDKKVVNATIRRRMSALQHCYEKALRAQPSLKGKITYSITVSAMGRVSSVQIEQDSLGSASVRNCTTAKIKGWRFPSEGAQESAEVTFNVVFSGAS
ncbi:MAG: AgmX/PglI C-terminal domain-containing protein [Nannocystaceae bacterium]